MKTMELEYTLKEYTKHEKINNKGVFLSRLITANSKIFKEVMKTMPEEVLLDLEEALSGTVLETKWKEEGEEEGIKKGKIEGIEYLASIIKEGNSLEEAVKIAMEGK